MIYTSVNPQCADLGGIAVYARFDTRVLSPFIFPCLYLVRTHVEPIPPSFTPSSAQSDLSSILFAHPSGGETK